MQLRRKYWTPTRPQLENYKNTHAFAAYGVIDLTPETPGIDDILGQCSKEHWHDPEGQATFFPQAAASGTGLISVPSDVSALCVFSPAQQETSYTQSGIENEYEPVCLGPAYFAYQARGRVVLILPSHCQRAIISARCETSS